MTVKPIIPRTLALRYSHLVFYVERDAHVEVWRVLHGERDIPAWMKSPEDL